MKVAVLGTWHVHTQEYTEAVIKDERSELVCVWDKDAEKGTAFAEKMETKYEADLDKILADEDIDSVVICTATNEHKEIITKAAQANKNIFTEKVLAFTTADAEEMKAEIDKTGKKFTISYPHRTWPKLRFAKEIAEKGVLGDITYARVRNVHNGSSAGWLPPHFYDKTQCGGGAMMDLGAHPMYTLAWIMGEPKSIVSMFTTATNKPVEDNAVCVIEFAGGAIGVSETGFVSQNNPYTLELSGTKGALMIHGDDVSYCCGETEDKWLKVENLPEEQKLPIYQWIDAVNDDTVAPFGTNEAVTLTKFMEGAYKAIESGTRYTF